MAIISIANHSANTAQQIAHFYSTHSPVAISWKKQKKKILKTRVVIEILKINGSWMYGAVDHFIKGGKKETDNAQRREKNNSHGKKVQTQRPTLLTINNW